MYWGMLASENLLGFKSSLPKEEEIWDFVRF